jgi:hypothetical protein
MSELRPLVEMAFELLDYLCSGQFKLGPQVSGLHEVIGLERGKWRDLEGGKRRGMV